MSIVSLVIAPSLAKMSWCDNSSECCKKQTTQTNVIINKNKQGSTINHTNTIVLSVAKK
jgi:hypothetical protein